MSVELKPMGVGSLFDKTFRMSFSKFKDVLKINLLFFLFLLVLFGAIGALLYFGGFYTKITGQFSNIVSDISSMSSSQVMSLAGPIMGWTFVLIILLLIPAMFYSGLMSHLFLQSFVGEKWTLRESFKVVGKKLGSLMFSLLPMIGIGLAIAIGAGIVLAILMLILKIAGIIIGYIALIIFMLYVAVVYAMVCPVIIKENLPGGQAVMRAFKLGSYNFFGLVGAYLLLFLLLIFIAIIFGAVFQLFNFIFSGSAMIMMISVGVYALFYILLELFLGAVAAAFIVSIFYNQKIRYESFGVESLVKDYVQEIKAPENK